MYRFVGCIGYSSTFGSSEAKNNNGSILETLDRASDDESINDEDYAGAMRKYKA
jgi:hypothetical protein